MTDDGSTDGTSDAVRRDYPRVTIQEGSGTLFWGGGMRKSMEAALGGDFDYILWLNDDVELLPGSVQALVRSAESKHALAQPSVIVGSMADGSTQRLSYGGFDRKHSWHPTKLARVSPLPNAMVECDTINGNCVLIPREIVDEVGLIDKHFPHQLGDIDYGFRVRRAGYGISVAPSIVGYCSENSASPKWAEPGVPLLARVKSLLSPLGRPIAPHAIFMWRYAGVLGLLLFAASFAKVVVQMSLISIGWLKAEGSTARLKER